MVRRFLTICILTGFLLNFELPAQTLQPNLVPHTASVAVFQQTGNALQALKVKQDLNLAGAIDYAKVTASLRVMFAHMDETGMTDTLEQYILTNPSRFTDYPTEPELQPIVAQVPLDERVAFLAYIQENGLAAFHKAMLRYLDEQTLAMRLHERGRFRLAQYPTQGQKQQKLNQDPVCEASFYTGWASLYFGIIGFVVGGPIGVALFWGGLTLGGYSIITGC